MTHTRAIGALTLGAMLSLGTATTRADIVNGQLPDLTPNRSVLAFAEVPDEKAKMILTGTLNGGQTVPPSPSQAAGVAYMGYYKKSNQICWQVTYTPLEGNEVDAHLHAGSVGEARTPFLLNLPPFPSTVKEGCASLDVTDKRTRNQILKLMKKGQTYVNVHSDLIVDDIEIGATGEIRGQMLPRKGIK